MKQLTVKYFALYREVCGTGAETVNTDAGTPAALFAQLSRSHPGLERFAAARVAVNEALADWDHALEDGDEVLFFPPVAGG